jgi:carbohydrate-binding DOMON domain-containing protein
MQRLLASTALAVLIGVIWTAPSFADEITFTDPAGDDNGPGAYIYPTDAAYGSGCFDMTAFTVKAKGKKVEFAVDVKGKLKDPWRMEVGFAVQMMFIFIDTDGAEGSGFTDGLPGLNVSFASTDAWDRVVILSPQTSGRVKSEVESKVPAEMQEAVVVPTRVKGFGRTISTSVKLEELGEGDPATWGYQVIMQSNEGFPAGTDLLTRKVNEFEGQHRFGGGTDFDCDPHVIDILAGKGEGADDEVAAQHEMLAHECNPDGSAKQLAVLKMVHK